MNEDVSEADPNTMQSMDIDKDENSISSLRQPCIDVDDGEQKILTSQKEYDVFISFRGDDTRRKILSHLRKALIDSGDLNIFVDDDLKRGEQISDGLLNAISDSKFSLVIFSENYANSPWCLDEVAHISQLSENETQIVLPVFYDVDPADVRKQLGSYAVAFAKHEKYYNYTTIQKWTTALTRIASLAGWHSSQFRDDAELVEKIVDHIEKVLANSKTTTDDYSKGLFGIEKSVADLNELLSINTDNAATIIGIWGMGGLGKTTLADIMFRKIRQQFSYGCFLKDVREKHKSRGKDQLEKDFCEELCKGGRRVWDLNGVKRSLRHKKLLIVLDDVDDLEVVESLLKKDDSVWLNSDSKVIITSRDRQVLRNIVKDEHKIHRLPMLNTDAANEVFRSHAFKGNYNKNCAEDKEKLQISEQLVKYVEGLPLALKVLGSYLYERDITSWTDLLKKLQKAELHEKIKKVLQISYDGLDYRQKSIFLDIACFFRGNGKHNVRQMLDLDCDSFDHDIGVLVDKCLITLSYDTFGTLQMQNLLQETGRSIARGESENNPVVHSRIWSAQHICNVLQTTTGTSTIEGISNIHNLGLDGNEPHDIKVNPSAFEKMSSLKFLRLLMANSGRRFLCTDQEIDLRLPDGLIYLEWSHYPCKSLKSSFTPSNLVHLIMINSQLEKLWEGSQPVKNLKYVDLQGSKKLTCLPNLSGANLWKLNLQDCTSLVELPPVKFHDAGTNKPFEVYSNFTLWEIDEESRPGCDQIIVKPRKSDYWLMKDDCLLNLNGCSNLTTVSQMSGNIKYICLRSTAIEELDSSIGSLSNLCMLDLYNCRRLKNLPSSIRDLNSLKSLDMHGCESIDKFPELPKSIQELDLSGTSIEEVVPSSFESLPCLKHLIMENCTRLETLPTTLCKLTSILRLQFEGCFPASIERLVKLQLLDLRKCPHIKLPLLISNNMCELKIEVGGSNPTQQDWDIDISLGVTLEQSECRDSCLNKISFLKLHSAGFTDGDGTSESRHYEYDFWKAFTGCECLLSKAVKNTIQAKLKMKQSRNVFGDYEDLHGPRMSFCYPGNTIPGWFISKKGASVSVGVTQSDKFLGILFGIVVEFVNLDENVNLDESDIICECHLRFFSNDESCMFRTTLLRQKDTTFGDHHVFMWYLTKADFRNDLYVGKKTLFEFDIKKSNESRCIKRIKESGIYLMEENDAKEEKECHSHPTSNKKQYDVFISHDGTSKSIIGLLCKRLKDDGIETHADDGLKRGEIPSKASLDALVHSKFSLVIFSENYATLSWRLDELAHITQCMEKETQIVLPVFYDVDPADVREQRGSYAVAFAKHEERFKDTIIQKWKEALRRVATISGLHSSQSKNEAELVHEIFNNIREKLRSTSSSHHNLKQGIVGIDNSIADLTKLLSNSPRVGICGIGGLGKTTLAEVVFNQHCHQYDSHCFFRNVGKEYQKHGPNLEVEFFRQLSKEKDLQYEHLVSLKERLLHEKLLIVLDDVDNLEEYNCLLEYSHSWLNSESKLIITSRNQQVLRSIIGNDERMIYNLKEDLDQKVTSQSKISFDFVKEILDDDNQLPTISYSQKKYDVFISFRGEDTRFNFISHLHEKLKKGGIETYIDDKLERGEEISKALLEPIEDSKILIVVFSKDYASSSWCLSELAHILQCVERKTQIVVPVFYHVDPTDVRKQKRSYAEAFEKHEDRYNDTTIRRWRDALTKAANHSGWNVSKSSNEAEVVRDIFNFVRKELGFTSSSHHNLKQGIVGIDDSIAYLNKLLSNTPRIGICGMGGLGKTTLAEIVFNQSCHQYDSHCFFRNVRAEFQQNRNFKEEFFSKLSNEKDLQSGDLVFLKERLHHKKLLIVLDDVNDLEEYNCLLKDSHSWLNSESKLIITSRNQQVLRNIIGNDERMIYNMKELKEEEALELFCWHAFKRKSPEESYGELPLMFVKYAQGLPLALKVLGSHLFLKSKQVWKSLLNKIKVDPDEKVTSKLKISFDGLESKQKSIFLDIACFFRGYRKYLVRDILDDCGDFNIAIEVLIDRCLMTVSDKGTLQMHDLLQEMGWSIACGSNHNKCLENYSRLWMRQDICCFLTSNKASSTIEGIFHVADIETESDERSDDIINLDPSFFTKKNLDPSFFKKLPSLRLLKLSSNYIRIRLPDGVQDPFPDELRYLEWYAYPLDSLGSNCILQNLVYLSMKKSQLKELWKENQEVSNLKYVILSDSEKLTCLPNLSQGNLHMLCLDGCTSLVNLPPLRFHDILDDLDEEFEVMHKYNSLMVKFINDGLYTYASDFEAISYLVRKLSTNLLDLTRCSNLTTLPEITGNIKFICLSETAIKELHPSIFRLKNLLVLDLHMCEHLRELRNDFCELESLEYLDMHGCVSFDKFPRLPRSIKGLNLNGASIQEVDSSSFDCLPSLSILKMENCKKLESLPTTICKLKSLRELDLKGCSQLKSFPEILEPIENLRYLFLNESGIEVLPSSIDNLVMLERLHLSWCKNLKSIPTTICKLKSLESLDLEGCSQLESFPEILEPMGKLKGLCLKGTGIEVLPSSIANLVVLERLDLSGCKNLKSIPTSIFNMRNNFKIKIDEYPKLQILPYNDLPCLPVEGSSETTSSQLLLTHDQPYMCKSSCTSRANLNLHYDGVDFTCCECFLFYTIHNILATQYFMDKIFDVQYNGKEMGLINDTTTSFPYSGDSITQRFDKQSVKSFLFDLPSVTFSEYYGKYRDGKEKGLIEAIRTSFCYAGDAITQWFAYQSMGSSLQLNLPVTSSEDYGNFLGFALCIVVEFDPSILRGDKDVLDLKCKYNLKTKNGRNLQFCSTLQSQKAAHFDDSNLDSSSNHQVFVWYLYPKDICKKRYLPDDDFLNEVESGIFEFDISKGRIKQCGVRLVHRQYSD